MRAAAADFGIGHRVAAAGYGVQPDLGQRSAGAPAQESYPSKPIRFITSAPARVLHMIGRSPAMTVETVITFGRSRSLLLTFARSWSSWRRRRA